MGLSHWTESDNAADFKYVFEEKIRSEAIKLINRELKDEANEFNTPGYINVALLVEAGAITDLMMTTEQADRIIQCLERAASKWDSDLATDIKRMIRSMKKLRKKIQEREGDYD